MARVYAEISPEVRDEFLIFARSHRTTAQAMIEEFIDRTLKGASLAVETGSDSHADVLADVRRILERGGSDAMALRVVVTKLRG